MRLLFFYLVDTLARLIGGHPTYVPPTAEIPQEWLLMDLRKQMIEMHNDLRRIKGKNTRPLGLDMRLNQVAQEHADWMASNDRVEHERPTPPADVKAMEAGDGVFLPPIDLVKRITETYGFFVEGGQNLARGPLTVFDLMVAWKNSEEHCEVILNPGFRLCGFGIARDCQGRVVWCAIYVRPFMGNMTLPDEVGLDTPEPLLVG